MILFFASLFLFLLPFQVALPFGNESLPLLRFLALPLILFWTGIILMKREKILPSLLFLSLVPSFLIVVLLSIFLAIDPSLGWRKYIYLLNLFPLIFVWHLFLREPSQIHTLLLSLVWGAVVSASMGILFFLSQFIFGVAPVFHLLIEKVLPIFLGERLGNMVMSYPSLLVNIGGETWLRVTTFFPDPHVAAFFFGITACLALGVFLETKKYFFLFSVIILLMADLLTFSRGGYVGLIVAVITFIFIAVRKRQFPARWILGGVIGISLLILLGAPIIERFFSTFTLSDASSLDRLTLWQTAWETWQLHPWFGVGLGNYAEWIYPGAGENLPYYAHNLYLDVAVETGIFGLVFFLGMIGMAIQKAYTAAQEKSGVAQGVLAALMLYLAHSFFETALFSVPIIILLTLLLSFSFYPASKNHPVQ